MTYTPKHKLAYHHYMRTGGSAIAKWFVREFEDFCEIKNTHWHEPLRQKMQIVELRDVHIIGGIRDPYEGTYGAYTIWRMHPEGTTSYVDFSRNNTFSEFIPMLVELIKSGGGLNQYCTYEYYYTVNKLIPSNLHLIRVENLQAEFSSLVTDTFGMSNIDTALPVYNTMGNPAGKIRKGCPEYAYTPDVYTKHTAGIIRDTFNWIFEQGYYDENWRP